jgi:hypothetical protein
MSIDGVSVRLGDAILISVKVGIRVVSIVLVLIAVTVKGVKVSVETGIRDEVTIGVGVDRSHSIKGGKPRIATIIVVRDPINAIHTVDSIPLLLL